MLLPGRLVAARPRLATKSKRFSKLPPLINFWIVQRAVFGTDVWTIRRRREHRIDQCCVVIIPSRAIHAQDPCSNQESLSQGDRGFPVIPEVSAACKRAHAVR